MSGTKEGELALACLFLSPTAERLRALASAAAGVRWDTALLLLESHGVLGLAARNLALAGVEQPAEPRRALETRLEALRELELAFRLTLERFLAEAARERIDVVLLKGAALGLDIYRPGGLRSQADLDLLVRPEAARRAVAAAARAGLFPPAGALPLWWQRLVHFHAKLAPEPALLREVELHWALSHPSSLHAVTTGELFARARPVALGSVRGLVLDPHDRLLHLCTHLAGHAAHASGPPDRAHLLTVASRAGHPLRLKWLLDVRVVVESSWRELDPAELAARARAWNAAGELAWALAWVRAGLGLVPEAEGWTARVLELCGDSATPARSASRSEPETRPLPLLDFRRAALARYPRWVFPPRRFLERSSGRAPLAVRRLRHAGLVLAHTLLAAAALPVALLGTVLARPARRRARRAFHEPGRVLELVAAQRALRADLRGH